MGSEIPVCSAALMKSISPWISRVALWLAVSRIRVRTTGSCDPRPYLLRSPCYFAAWILRARRLSLAAVKTTDVARWYIFLHWVHAHTSEVTRGLPNPKLPLPGANSILGSIGSHLPPGTTWSNNINIHTTYKSHESLAGYGVKDLQQMTVDETSRAVQKKCKRTIRRQRIAFHAELQ